MEQDCELNSKLVAVANQPSILTMYNNVSHMRELMTQLCMRAHVLLLVALPAWLPAKVVDIYYGRSTCTFNVLYRWIYPTISSRNVGRKRWISVKVSEYNFCAPNF